MRFCGFKQVSHFYPIALVFDFTCEQTRRHRNVTITRVFNKFKTQNSFASLRERNILSCLVKALCDCHESSRYSPSLRRSFWVSSFWECDLGRIPRSPCLPGANEFYLKTQLRWKAWSSLKLQTKCLGSLATFSRFLTHNHVDKRESIQNMNRLQVHRAAFL